MLLTKSDPSTVYKVPHDDQQALFSYDARLDIDRPNTRNLNRADLIHIAFLFVLYFILFQMSRVPGCPKYRCVYMDVGGWVGRILSDLCPRHICH